MSNAWETTTDDVLTVLEQNGITVDIDMEEWKVDEIFDQLDHDRIEKSALRGLEMPEQTNFAYGDIKEQLTEMHII